MRQKHKVILRDVKAETYRVTRKGETQEQGRCRGASIVADFAIVIVTEILWS